MPSPTAKTRFLSTLAKKSWKPEPVPNIPTNDRRSDIAQTFIAIPTGYIPKMREMPRVGEWNSRNLIILKTTKITPPSTLEWLMDALLPLINFSLFFNPKHSYSKYLAYWFFLENLQPKLFEIKYLCWLFCDLAKGTACLYCVVFCKFVQRQHICLVSYSFLLEQFYKNTSLIFSKKLRTS